MKKFMFAAIATMVMVSVSNVFASSRMVAVSYTHLDVYKRQALGLGIGAALGNHRLAYIADGIYIKMWNHTNQSVTPVAVSYTHLF